MLLNEIFREDPNIDQEERARRAEQLKHAMSSMQRQAAALRQPSHAEKEAYGRRNQEHLDRRSRVEQALAPLAQKYSADQLEDFKREAETLVPPEELKLVDLETVFNVHNPEKLSTASKAWAWASYGQARNAGEVQGIGPTGTKNWTGD